MTETNSDLEIAEAAPTDGEGHPIHPERGHRICAGTKSDRTTPTEHGRERDDYEYCLLAAGWGVDDTSTGPCKHHLGAVDNRGKNNPAYEHGAYSEYQDFMFDSLGDRERAAVDTLDFDEHASQFARDVVKEAYAKYLRTGDDRFLREARQWASEFGVIEAAPEKHQVDGEFSVDQRTAVALDEETEEILDDLTGGR